MEKDLKGVKEHYQQNYFDEEISNRIKERVHQRIYPKQVNMRKKLFYFSSVAVAAFGLFIVLAFFSPAVANVAAKVPFLNMIFKSKPFTDVISSALTEKGYKFDGVGVQYTPKKVVSVNLLGTEEEVNKAKPEVEKIVSDLLRERDYDAYVVEVTRAERHEVVPTDEEQAAEEREDKILALVSDVLKGYGYESFSLGSDAEKNTVHIFLPNTETRNEEIKQKVQSELAAKGLGTFTIKEKVYDAKKKEREDRWMPVISTITEGVFGNRKYNVTGVGYTNKSSEYMTIKITTSVSSKDADYEEVMDNIESTIQEFLTSKETKEIIKDDAYKVIIISKDKKEKVVTN